MPTLTSGEKAPQIELEGMGGTRFSLADSLARGPLLLAFFKVSCPTCQYTFPFLERIFQQFRDQGTQVWGISQDDAAHSRQFTNDYSLTCNILLDGYPYEISRAYGVKYVPTLFLVMPDGHVELMSDGFCKVDLLKIQKRLATHFSVTPPPLFQPGDGVPEFKPG
jgi:peroxiredoxin